MLKKCRDDKVRILEMVSSGKISSSDGIELLEAIDTNYYKENTASKSLIIKVYDKNKKLKNKATIPMSIIDLGSNLIEIYIANTSNMKNKITKEQLLKAARTTDNGILFECWDDEHNKNLVISIE